MENLSFEIVSALLRYDPETGRLFWRHRSIETFVSGKHTAERLCRTWNAQFSGKEAFTSVDRHGYRAGLINRVKFNAHRVAWLLHHGSWPDGHIDHVNGVRDDNRIANLRDVSRVDNNRNARMRSDNTSGVVGVRWNKRDRKWHATITVLGRLKHIGYFDRIEDASAARKAAERALGFHPNHGRAA